LHVHIFGDDSKNDGTSAGAHYNPLGNNHGAPSNSLRHMGDLGNITANGTGIAVFDNVFDLLTLSAMTGNIIGRSVVVHVYRDDGNYDNDPLDTTGNAGGRLAVGIIGISNRFLPPRSSSSPPSGCPLICTNGGECIVENNGYKCSESTGINSDSGLSPLSVAIVAVVSILLFAAVVFVFVRYRVNARRETIQMVSNYVPMDPSLSHVKITE